MIRHDCLITRDEDKYIISCPLCDYLRYIYHDERGLVLVEDGEDCIHEGGVVGVSTTGVEVNQKDYLKPYEDFLEKLDE